VRAFELVLKCLGNSRHQGVCSFLAVFPSSVQATDQLGRCPCPSLVGVCSMLSARKRSRVSSGNSKKPRKDADDDVADEEALFDTEGHAGGNDDADMEPRHDEDEETAGAKKLRLGSLAL
jgi:hypothetical protein